MRTPQQQAGECSRETPQHTRRHVVVPARRPWCRFQIGRKRLKVTLKKERDNVPSGGGGYGEEGAPLSPFLDEGLASPGLGGPAPALAPGGVLPAAYSAASTASVGSAYVHGGAVMSPPIGSSPTYGLPAVGGGFPVAAGAPIVVSSKPLLTGSLAKSAPPTGAL